MLIRLYVIYSRATSSGGTSTPAYKVIVGTILNEKFYGIFDKSASSNMNSSDIVHGTEFSFPMEWNTMTGPNLTITIDKSKMTVFTQYASSTNYAIVNSLDYNIADISHNYK